MYRYTVTLLVILLLAVAADCTSPASCTAEETLDENTLRRVIDAESIPVDNNLGMKGGFDDTFYYGLIDSQKALDKVWSGLIDKNKPYSSRLGLGVPDAPEVDFERFSVIWFADKGANASAVDSITVAAYRSDSTMMITIVVLDSSSKSDKLNLWKIPKTTYRPVFSVLHKNEEELKQKGHKRKPSRDEPQ